MANTLDERLAAQWAEFDALGKLAQRLKSLPAIVDDGYPEARHYYESALRTFLEACKANGRSFPLAASPGTKRGVNYIRNGDMTPSGGSVLVAHIQHDGDVCLRINNRDVNGDFKHADIEFCASGGKSVNTLHALHNLVEAMVKDGA